MRKLFMRREKRKKLFLSISWRSARECICVWFLENDKFQCCVAISKSLLLPNRQNISFSTTWKKRMEREIQNTCIDAILSFITKKNFILSSISLSLSHMHMILTKIIFLSHEFLTENNLSYFINNKTSLQIN